MVSKEGVEDITFPFGQMIILTKEKNVYVTGLYSISGTNTWPGGMIPGWSELENHYDFVEILSNASLISGEGRQKMAISNGELFKWGWFVTNPTYTPTKSTLVSGNDIRKIATSNYQSGIVTNDGKLYFENYTFDNKQLNFRDISNQFDGKKIKDIVINTNYTGGREAIVLTEDGCLYGKGYKNLLGLGITTSETTDDFVRLPIENVAQITGNAECFIAVKEDGTVWGTGKNTYGILGRWVGTDRNMANSRYRTTYDWVECPELEL